MQRYTGMLRHPEAPLIGHVDRLVIPEGAKIAAHRREIRTDLGLEAKTAHALASSRGDEWGEDGTDQIPSSYLTQAAAYMALTGCSRWDLACLFGNSDFRIYHMSRDPELEAMLIEEASRWWRNHVVADVPPDPQSEAEARQRWQSHQPGKVLDIDAGTADLLREYAAAKAREKALETEIKAIRDRLIPALADADAVAFGGATLATHRANKAGEKTDWQAAFRDATRDVEPDVIDRFVQLHTKTTPGARVLRLTKEMF